MSILCLLQQVGSACMRPAVVHCLANRSTRWIYHSCRNRSTRSVSSTESVHDTSTRLSRSVVFTCHQSKKNNNKKPEISLGSAQQPRCPRVRWSEGSSTLKITINASIKTTNRPNNQCIRGFSTTMRYIN